MSANARHIRPRSLGATILGYVTLGVLLVFTLGPFLWLMDTAFKSAAQVFQIPTVWFPHPFDWHNLALTWESVPFGQFYFNTFWVASVTTLGQVFTSVLAGYAFARMRFRGRQALFLIALSTLMIPFQVILIPTFLIVKDLGLLNNLWAVILPNVATGFGIFLMRQFFLQIPVEIEEAAVMDGASRLRILWSILIPISRAAIATLILFAFLFSWNNFLWPLVALTTPSNMTIQVGLSFFQSAHVTEYNRLMAGSLISLVPIIVLFLFTQKYFVEGIVTGSVKG